MKPEIYVEFTLVFDNDYDVSEITKTTGLAPFACKCRSDNSFSPLTGKKMEGFWKIKSKIYEEFSADKAINEIMKSLQPHISLLSDICQSNNGEAIFCIVISFDADNKPAIYFDRPFLSIVHMLQATVQTDMYIM